MKWLRGIIEEIYSMFVDDGVFALSILAWAAIIWLIAVRLDLGTQIGAPLLGAGLIAILIESAVRRARK
jgi:hypothetical protein